MNRFTARPATTTDHSHYARLFLELGVDDPVMPVERWVTTMAPAMLVLEDGDGAVVGYAYVQVLQGVGYVRHVVVDPGRRGQGLGRVLMGEIAGRLGDPASGIGEGGESGLFTGGAGEWGSRPGRDPFV